MLVSINWLKELVQLKVSVDEVIRLLPLRTIGTKEVTDRFIELDMKGYNRADLLSLRGVATEIAAITDSPINFNNQDNRLNDYSGLPTADVNIKNPELAPLYCIAKIENLTVAKSPEEWVTKLNDSGMRSVNNVADITNLIMIEYGQPLHAFDAHAVKAQTIIVRTASRDEKLVTLDNKTRTLLPTDLLIADPEKPLGLAGVMGGKESEVTEKTTTILLEAAIFDPLTLRETSTRLALTSEASKRFQHGLTEERLFQAFQTAIEMYKQIGGKLSAVSVTGGNPRPIPTIRLTHDKLNSLVGVEMAPEFIEEALNKLHFQVTKIDEGLWEVSPPYFRLDIELEEDVIEEVARMYGYEKIPAKTLQGELPEKVDQSLFELISKLKSGLVGLGQTEIQTYSFYSTATLNNLQVGRDTLVRIANPMSAETEYMRNFLWPNLLEKSAENLKHFEDVAIFEIGKVYHHKEETLPEERYKLAIALSNNTNEPIQELNALVNNLFNDLGKDIKVEPDSQSDYFHPTRNYQIKIGERVIGKMAEVHPRLALKFGTEKRVAICEIEIDSLKN